MALPVPRGPPKISICFLSTTREPQLMVRLGPQGCALLADGSEKTKNSKKSTDWSKCLEIFWFAASSVQNHRCTAAGRDALLPFGQHPPQSKLATSILPLRV